MDIRIENVHKTFYPNTNRSHDALIDINLTIHKGDFITIVGGNGAGKSTFLNAISGSFPLDKGHIYMGEAAIEQTAEYERAKYISRVYQNPLQGTAPRMTVAENLSLALRRGLKRGLKKGYTAEELEQFKNENRFRTIKTNDKNLFNFSSNDYLAIAKDRNLINRFYENYNFSCKKNENI
mgnify:CR=1 FL=1